MLTSIDVKFILRVSFFFSRGLLDKGFFKSANILQIADVVRRVVFLLFLPGFWTTVRRETSLMFCIYSLRKQLKLVPRFSWLTVQ